MTERKKKTWEKRVSKDGREFNSIKHDSAVDKQRKKSQNKEITNTEN